MYLGYPEVGLKVCFVRLVGGRGIMWASKQSKTFKTDKLSKHTKWMIFSVLPCTFASFKLQIKKVYNTPGTAGGPGGRDPTLKKSRKNVRKITFFS